jgi:hypothetical protein
VIYEKYPQLHSGRNQYQHSNLPVAPFSNPLAGCSVALRLWLRKSHIFRSSSGYEDQHPAGNQAFDKVRGKRRNVMRLFKREAEGGFTIADWDDGFVGLNRNEVRTGVFGFQFERWTCCPGAFELNIELFGLMFVFYSEGGPCQLEAFLDEVDEPVLELALQTQLPTPAKGRDWDTVPSPAGH